MTHESDMTSTFASLLDDEDGEYYEDEVEDVDESLLVRPGPVRGCSVFAMAHLMF